MRAKVINSTARVRFQDADPFNHLNNGKYIDYMMNAREDQVEAFYGLNLMDIAKSEGVGWVVATNQIAYINAALTMENLYLDSQLMNFSDKHLDVEVRMWNADQTQLKAFMWVRFVHFDLRKKRVHQHADYMMDLFSEVALPTEHTSFEARNQYWRQHATRPAEVVE